MPVRSDTMHCGKTPRLLTVVSPRITRRSRCRSLLQWGDTRDPQFGQRSMAIEIGRRPAMFIPARSMANADKSTHFTARSMKPAIRKVRMSASNIAGRRGIGPGPYGFRNRRPRARISSLMLIGDGHTSPANGAFEMPVHYPHMRRILARTSTGSRARLPPAPPSDFAGGHEQVSKCASIGLGMKRVRWA